MNATLLQVTTELLERRGALVEQAGPALLEVLLPTEWQRALALPELSRLGFAAEVPAEARRVGLDPEWMERLARLLGSDGRTPHRLWPLGFVPPGQPERLLEYGLVLPNAVWRLQSAGPAWTRYLVLMLRYTATADEKREGILRVGINLANGALLEPWLEELLAAERAEEGEGALPLPRPVDEESLPPLWPVERLDTVLQRLVPLRIGRALRPFLEGLQRRQERDLKRLHAYHADLGREAVRRDGAAAPELLQNRLVAIAGEYRAKTADLKQKYAVVIQTTWVQSLLLTMPVWRLHLLIRRRKGERHLVLDWNPAVRRLEALPCEAGLATGEDATRWVCDEALHLLSTAGQADCPHCGRPFCRACHPRHCPRCRVPYLTTTG